MDATWNAKSNGRTGTGKRIVAVGLLILVLAAVACSGSDSGDSAGGGADRAADREAAAPVGAPAQRAASQGSSSGARAGGDSAQTYASDEALVANTGSTSGRGAAARLPRIGPSVIKTATVEIGVPDDEVDESINEAIAVAGRYGGFVLSSQLGRRDAGGTLTMRIPATRFEAALTDLEGLGKVRRESISGEDVGQEFVDLQARLRNWESQEAVLLKLMDRAKSVIDTIRVQNELSRVQLEIEQLRGRLTFLEDQTSLGTITATFAPLSSPAPSAPSRFAEAWARAVDLMQSFVAGMIVTLGVLLPLSVIALVIYLLFRGLRPRLSS